MIETSNALVERRQPLRRNDSFSTDGSSVVNSSVAAADIIQQYVDLSKTVAEKTTITTNNPANMKFENSEGIHVGNKFILIFPPKNEEKESRSNSFVSYTSEKFSKYFEVPTNWNGKRKLFWILIIISLFSIITAASISAYYILRNNDDINSESTTIRNHIIFPDYFVIRDEWGAEPSKSENIPKLNLPIKRIIIGHTGGQFCRNETECIETVKSMQFQNPFLDDIPYNFLIGGDERVYEGRGFEFEGQHTENLNATEYNSIGICIAFIGNYQAASPTSSQIEILQDFISYFVEGKYIAEDHIIVSQDDLKYNDKKADALNEAVKSLKNYRSLYKIYRREEWEADSSKKGPAYFNRTMDWILIGHTATPLCNDLSKCITRARQLQEYSMQTKGLSDILYNLFFGGDGYAFEGRGWDINGAHAIGFNEKSIGIGAIGDFTTVPPNNLMINAMMQVFDDALALGKITQDYKIFGRNDFGDPGPGAAFMSIIKTWERYGNRTLS